MILNGIVIVRQKLSRVYIMGILINYDIDINKSVLEEVRSELATQRSNLNAMAATTPEEVRKGAEKELKKQEKKSDNLTKRIDKGTAEIYDIQAEIRDLNYELEKLKQDEKFALTRVMEQREIIMQIKEMVIIKRINNKNNDWPINDNEARVPCYAQT